MRNEHGIIKDDLTVSDEFRLDGIVAGSVTVTRNGALHHHGVIGEDITVEEGGRAIVHGVVGGDAVNRGGKLEIYGVVGGKIRGDSGETVIRPDGGSGNVTVVEQTDYDTKSDIHVCGSNVHISVEQSDNDNDENEVGMDNSYKRQRNDKARVDEAGLAFAGSQLQIQIYVNRYPEPLNEAILDSSPNLAAMTPSVTWTSPLERDGFKEYRDRDFLDAIGMSGASRYLSAFWPKNGPCWDALATVRAPSRSVGAILVEAKSHPPEVFSNGCKASAKSLEKINKALDETKRWLGVSGNCDWTGPLYQYANRLAHLYFLREIAGTETWLVNVYFVDDPHSPTSRDKWNNALKDIKRELGIENLSIPYCVDIFLEAKKRNEMFV